MRRRFVLICLIACGLGGCAAPGGPGGTETGSGDCAAMKRQQDTMVAQGKANSDAYRRLLDRYLARCF